jgi:hypothetical protein
VWPASNGRPADGPNAADFLLAMDAAVMAAEGRVDGFVLMTADDGFAAVAHGLKMRGVSVYTLIPFNGGPVPRRLAAMADLAILVPIPLPDRWFVTRRAMTGSSICTSRWHGAMPMTRAGSL